MPETACLTSEYAEEALVVSDTSPATPGDLEEISLPSNDKAVIPSRSGQKTPQTTTTTFNNTALGRPGIIPAFLFPIHISDSLHEHIRERAPPSLV